MSAPAEVPEARPYWAHASNYKARPAGQAQPYDLVVVHITSGHPDALGDAQMWAAPNHGTSAHFAVGQDGTIYQCVPLRFAAQHAHDANGHSVGIEHCAREPGAFGRNDAGMPPTQEQLVASAKLVARLLAAAGLAPAKGITIMGHAEADPKTTHEKCPDGAPWPWGLYLKLVDDAYAALEQTPPPLAA